MEKNCHFLTHHEPQVKYIESQIDCTKILQAVTRVPELKTDIPMKTQ